MLDIKAPMSAQLVQLAVQPGQALRRGEPLLVLEAMKMEHEIVAPAAGTVTELRVEAGTQVETGAILVVIE